MCVTKHQLSNLNRITMSVPEGCVLECASWWHVTSSATFRSSYTSSRFRLHTLLQVSYSIFFTQIGQILASEEMRFTETEGSLPLLTSAHRWYLPWTRRIQSTTSHHIYLSSILLSAHLYLDLPRGLFTSDLSTKILYAFLVSYIRYYTEN
jgi:hypothetical protein